PPAHVGVVVVRRGMILRCLTARGTDVPTSAGESGGIVGGAGPRHGAKRWLGLLPMSCGGVGRMVQREAYGIFVGAAAARRTFLSGFWPSLPIPVCGRIPGHTFRT